MFANRLLPTFLACGGLLGATLLLALFGTELLVIRCDRSRDSCSVLNVDALGGRQVRSFALSELTEVLPCGYVAETTPAQPGHSVTVRNWELHTTSGATHRLRTRNLADYASMDLTQPLNRFLQGSEERFTWRAFYMGTPGLLVLFLLPTALGLSVVALRRTRLTVHTAERRYALSDRWLPGSTLRSGPLREVEALELRQAPPPAGAEVTTAQFVTLVLSDPPQRVFLGQLEPAELEPLIAALDCATRDPSPSAPKLTPLLRGAAAFGCAWLGSVLGFAALLFALAFSL